MASVLEFDEKEANVMSNEYLQPTPDLAGRPEVTKFIVEKVMDEVELNGLSPSVQTVRARMGGATEKIGAFVTEIKSEREAAVEAAIADDLLKVSKKIFQQARESAKRLYSAQVERLSGEADRLKQELEKAKAEVVDLTEKLHAVSVDRAAKEQLLTERTAAHQATERDLKSASSKFESLKLEQDHMSLELAQRQAEALALQRDKRAAEAREGQLQAQLNLLADNLNAERVGHQSARELLEREVKAHQGTQAAKAVSKEDLAVARSDLSRARSEVSAAREEVEQIKRALLAEQHKVQVGQGREESLTRINGGYLAQLELLIERVRPIAANVAEEFEAVLERGRK